MHLLFNLRLIGTKVESLTYHVREIEQMGFSLKVNDVFALPEAEHSNWLCAMNIALEQQSICIGGQLDDSHPSG